MKPVPILRAATPADREVIEAILSASYSRLLIDAYEPAVLARTLPLMTRASPVLLGSGRYFLSGLACAPAGACGGWSRERPGTGTRENGVGHIRHVATHPEQIRRGLGRAIVQHCFAEARAEGVSLMECYATLNAEAFYRSCGFSPVTRLDVAIGDAGLLPSLLMTRDL